MARSDLRTLHGQSAIPLCSWTTIVGYGSLARERGVRKMALVVLMALAAGCRGPLDLG